MSKVNLIVPLEVTEARINFQPGYVYHVRAFSVIQKGNDPVKLILVFTIVVPISIVTLKTHTTPLKTSKVKTLRCLCPSECFKAKCAVVFTRREVLIVAEMKISRHRHHLESFKAIPDLFCSAATWPCFPRSCGGKKRKVNTDSGAEQQTSGFMYSHLRCRLGSSES